MAKPKNKIDEQYFTIAKLKHEIMVLEHDGSNENLIAKKKLLLEKLETKQARAVRAQDMVDIERKEPNGTLRRRQCCKDDVAAFKRQGYKVSDVQISERPAAPAEDTGDGLEALTKAALLELPEAVEAGCTNAMKKAAIVAAVRESRTA